MRSRPRKAIARRKDNIGLEDDHFSRWYQRACNSEWPTRVAASNSTRSASSSAFLRTSTTCFFFISFFRPFPIPSVPIVHLNEDYVYASYFFFTKSIHEFVEMSVLVLEPEVRACSVVSSGSSSLFCTMTSVYFCFFYVLYIFLSIPHSAPLYSILSFSLPPCHSFAFPLSSRLLSPSAPYCRECASPLAKLNHFHWWTHTSRTELTRRSRASLYVISAHQH